MSFQIWSHYMTSCFSIFNHSVGSTQVLWVKLGRWILCWRSAGITILIIQRVGFIILILHEDYVKGTCVWNSQHIYADILNKWNAHQDRENTLVLFTYFSVHFSLDFTTNIVRALNQIFYNILIYSSFEDNIQDHSVSWS